MQHDFPFDPTYGYSLDQLRQVGAPAGPADFDDFWRATYADARAVPLNLAHRPIDSPDPNIVLEEVEFDALGGVRIGGWLTRPREGAIRRGVVVGHGYGGREAPDVSASRRWDAAAIFPCARGFHRSARPDIPGQSAGHVLCGITRRDTYVHRGCCADLWAAASALLEMVPSVAGRLDYQGGSFGGGIGALALPWDDRFRRAFLDVPSFGNHPLRLQLPCTGSGESVRRYAQTHPEVIDVLQYFDAATAARRLRIPTYVAAAVFDPAVPPPGQFAVYNAIPAEKDLFVHAAAHFEFPGQAREEVQILRALDQWFTR